MAPATARNGDRIVSADNGNNSRQAYSGSCPPGMASLSNDHGPPAKIEDDENAKLR